MLNQLLFYLTVLIACLQQTMSGNNDPFPRGVLRIKHGDSVTTSKQLDEAVRNHKMKLLQGKRKVSESTAFDGEDFAEDDVYGIGKRVVRGGQMDEVTKEFLKSKRQHKFYSKAGRWQDKQEIQLEEEKDEYACEDEAVKAEASVPPTNFLKQAKPKNSFTPTKLVDTSTQIKNVSINSSLAFDAYDRILCSMSAHSNGDISSMINNDKDGLDICAKAAQATLSLPLMQKEPDYDDDQFQAYNIKALRTGTFNEWRDKVFQWDDRVQHLNQKVFGNETFKESQKEIINAALSKRDVMALIPTGGGKSLTFQLPALVDTGYTFVVMPLISLIEDQAYQLKQRSVPCYKFSRSGQASNQSEEMRQFYSTLLSGKDERLKLIYLTPEKFVNSQSFLGVLDKLYHEGRISRFVIDEVHCVSHWGQDFRKDYRELSILRVRYPKVPLLVLTATATIPVKYDIVQILKLENVVFFQSSFNRPNLIYKIRDKSKLKKLSEDIIVLLREKFIFMSGIIYCLSRYECEQLCAELSEFEVKCDFYHARMSDAARRDVQQRWMRNEIHIIIATIAFGMGINKSDVRFVIHTTLPKSLENYAQEVGRAGRDGRPSECILYYSYADRKRLEHFIVTNNDSTMGRKNENLHALYKIIEFCEEPYLCRRKILLNYLGEDFRTRNCNSKCDNCQKELRVAEVDFTEQARLIVYFVDVAMKKRMDLTVLQIVKFLQGKQQGIKNPAKSSKMDDVKKAFFGKLYDCSDDCIKRMIMKLLINKVLKEKFNSFKVEQTILVYLIPGRRVDDFKQGKIRIILTDCVEKDDERELKRQQKAQDRELAKKHIQAKPKAVEPSRPISDRVLSQLTEFDLKPKKLPTTTSKPPDGLITEELAQNLSRIEVQSIIDPGKLKELSGRFHVVRQSFLSRLAGKDFFVFTNTFTDNFLEMLALLVPRCESDIVDNELLSSLSESNLAYLKKYAFAFVVETQHFLQQNEDIAAQIRKFGQAYKLTRKATPEQAAKAVPEVETDGTADSKTPIKYTSPAKIVKSDRFSKPATAKQEDGCGSDLDVTEVGQQNKSAAPIKKKIVRVKKPSIQQAIQKKYERHKFVEQCAQRGEDTMVREEHNDYGFSQ